MRKTFVAMDLEDFHKPSKRWQGGSEETVHIRVIGGKNLNSAKGCARSIDPKKSWYVFPLQTLRNVVYREVDK